jgi:hypothetical protein
MLELSEACKAAGIPVAPSFTINDAAKILGLSYSWVYKAVRTGLRSAVKVGEGPHGNVQLRWMIPAEVIAAWLAKVQSTTERKQDKHLNPAAYYRSRSPSHTAVRMVKRKVLLDPNLTEAQRALFLQRLEVYLQEWDELHGGAYAENVLDPSQS